MTAAGTDGLATIRRYGLADLQRLDDECREAARSIGLDVPEVVFHLAPAEQIYDIAARGLPGRYPHWRFGQEYERMKLDHDHGRSRIYELVLNTRPYQAFLLEGNSWVAQLLVIAHVFGHCWFFEHNDHFRRADRKFLHRVRAGAERIEQYSRRHGADVVEDFVDSVQALARHAPLELTGATPPSSPPVPPPAGRYDDLFPHEAEAARRAHDDAAARWAARFPRDPQPDLLGFLLTNSPHLEDWERDVISILRDEAAYFAPQRRTKIANEGFASWVHNEIVQALQLGTEDFVEFNRLNAEIRQPHALALNPYSVGLELWREVERIHDAPTGDERLRYDGAGRIAGRERLLELAAVCDDAALVASYLTEDVCDRCRLFAWERAGPQQLRCTSREAEALRDQLVAQLLHLGVPTVEIVDADAFHAGGLWLVHRHEGVGLDEEYATHTLPHVARLWGRRVHLETIAPGDSGGARWYSCTPGVTVAAVHTTQPTS